MGVRQSLPARPRFFSAVRSSADWFFPGRWQHVPAQINERQGRGARAASWATNFGMLAFHNDPSGCHADLARVGEAPKIAALTAESKLTRPVGSPALPRLEAAVQTQQFDFWDKPAIV